MNGKTVSGIPTPGPEPQRRPRGPNGKEKVDYPWSSSAKGYTARMAILLIAKHLGYTDEDMLSGRFPSISPP